MHHFVSSVFHEFHQQMQNQHPQNHTQNTYTTPNTMPNTNTNTNTDRREHEENDTTHHFSHPHQLNEVASKNILDRNKNLACFGCKLPLSSGTGYACSDCNFYLHKFCFDLPQSAHFDSHPKHTLTLLYPPYRQGNCDACGESCDAFTYNCAPCNYSVHANCATLLQPDPRNERDQYIATFLGHKVSEIKALKSQLEESTVEQQQTIDEEEANNILQMAMEEELRRRRHNMYTAQMMFSASSMNAMGRIG